MAEPSFDDAEINFAANHRNYVNVSDIPNLTEITCCSWIKTNDTTKAGTLYFYTTRDKEKDVIAIALGDFRGVLKIQIGNTKA